MRAATQAEQFDRNHDYRKHEPRPSDPAVKRVLQVAYLTAYLDTLLNLGAIPLEYRDGIRATVDSTRKVFELPALNLGSVEAPLSRKNPVDIIFGADHAKA